MIYTLAALNARFISVPRKRTKDGWKYADRFRDAHGVIFECPKCKHEDKGLSHFVVVLFTNTHASQKPAKREMPGLRMVRKGSSLETLSLSGAAHAHPCGWPIVVARGEVTV